ncbi:UPF0175 family protein [Zunongwangia sp. H14]|uniref:UPF0175 family protein n=1 Tax=Zunongwangia sp. H14 TaxID=3240792 RepID=UPI0035671F29
MKTVKLQVPDHLDLEEYEFLMILASKLYEDSKLSLGEAATMVGVSKPTFIELLNKYKISLFSRAIEDLHSDISNA